MIKEEKEKIKQFKSTVKMLLSTNCLKEIQDTCIKNKEKYCDSVDTYYMDNFLAGYDPSEFKDYKTYLKTYYDHLSEEDISEILKETYRESILVKPYLDNLSLNSMKELMLLGKAYILDYTFEIIYNLNKENPFIVKFMYEIGYDSPIGECYFGAECRIPLDLYYKLSMLFIKNKVPFTVETDNSLDYLDQTEKFNKVFESIMDTVKSEHIDITNLDEELEEDYIHQYHCSDLEELDDNTLNNIDKIYKAMEEATKNLFKNLGKDDTEDE